MPIVDIAGMLVKAMNKAGKPTDKVAIRVTFKEGLALNADNRALAQPLAEHIAERIKRGLERGQLADGSPLPSITASTTQRRKREAAQGARGGEPDPSRYKKGTPFFTRAKRTYDRDYRFGKGSFVPREGGPRGIVSGILANSFVVRVDRSGKGFMIYVASRRGRPRIGETQSALDSVFKTAPLWDARAMASTETQRVIQKTADSLLGNSIRKLVSQATSALSALNQANVTDDVGD